MLSRVVTRGEVLIKVPIIRNRGGDSPIPARADQQLTIPIRIRVRDILVPNPYIVEIHTPLSIVARDIRASHDVRTLVISWDDLESDDSEAYYQQDRGGHADEGETSIIRYLRPDLVAMDKAAIDYRTEPRRQLGYAPGKFDRESESGLYGDPTLATAEKGKALLAIMRQNFLTALDQFGQSP